MRKMKTYHKKKILVVFLSLLSGIGVSHWKAGVSHAF